MKVGITGGNGFIGTYVAEELLSRGHEPLIFDHHGHRNRWLPDVEVMLGDVRDATAVTELAAHAEGIIHLAAVLGTQETIRNPRPAAETNVIGGLNVLEAACQYDLPGVYIGVGNHWMNNSYSISKTTVERYVRMFNTDRGTRVNVVRAVNAYGPRQSVAAPFGPGKVRKITPAFVCRALSGMPVEVYGDGEQVSDMVWAGDVARTLVAALETAAAGKTLDRVVEAGPVLSATVNDVARRVIAAAARLGRPEVPLAHLPMRPGEQAGANVTANADTLLLVGIDPGGLVPLEDGIARTVAWYADHEGVTWTAPAHTSWVAA
jgi:UDP-glucose 4-epimerase